MSFVVDHAALNRYVNQLGGPVARYMERTADRVVIEAEGLAPVGEGKGGRHLWQSIRRGPVHPGPFGLAVKVGSPFGYAAAVVKGARPHVIRARNASALRFVAKDGTLVFAQSVNHPGNQANNFLMRAARRIIRGGD